MTLQEAMAKAAKLLQLSKSSNPHEAALAAQRAQEILVRFDIDQAALNMDAGNSEPDEAIENFTNRAPLDQAAANLSRWKISLASCIARANSCQAYQSGSAIGIVGRPSDVEKVRYLYDMLVREIDRLTERDGKGCGKNYRTEYRHGAVEAIAEKLADARRKVANEMRAENTGSALVRINSAIEKIEQKDRALAAWVQTHMRLRTKTTRVNVNRSARQAGYEAGQSISLNSARGSLTASRKAIP